MNRRFLSIAAIMVIVIGTVFHSITLGQEATETGDVNDATPAPLIAIPTATPFPTPTLVPSQLIDVLGDYGLQPTDFPDFTTSPLNATVSLDELVQQLSESYPDQALVARSLGALYETYGVIGSSVAGYFSEPCASQVIFGVETWIRGTVSSSSASALVDDQNLHGLYQGLYNWNQTEFEALPGKHYLSPVPAAVCATPSTKYIVEYALDRFIIAVSVYAPDTTDINLVRTVLTNLVASITQRVQPGAVTPFQQMEPTDEANPSYSDVLYEANWLDGADDWPTTFGWSAFGGMLINDGSSADMSGWKSNWTAAPFEPQTPDYAVEAEIQMVRDPGCGSFGLVIRGEHGSLRGYQTLVHNCGYKLLVLQDPDVELARRDYSSGSDWHLYRVEAEGNVIRVFVDGIQVFEETDNRFLSPGRVGILSDRTQINVRSFRVLAMPT